MSEPLDEETEISWMQMLKRFEEHAWPLFKDIGVSKDTALIVWTLNRMTNEIDNLIEYLKDDG